jgi:FeS assembly SUF system regulator
MVIMAFMAREPVRLFQAREIAEYTNIALPTVSKLLKKLTKSALLISERGKSGGYLLSCPPSEITVAALIQTLEGPIALTECNLAQAQCKTESVCAIRTPWLHINRVIISALGTIKLSDLAHPKPAIGAKHVHFRTS